MGSLFDKMSPERLKKMKKAYEEVALEKRRARNRKILEQQRRLNKIRISDKRTMKYFENARKYQKLLQGYSKAWTHLFAFGKSKKKK